MIRAKNEYCHDHKDWHQCSHPPHLPGAFSSKRVCEACGQEFIIASPRQRHCPTCCTNTCTVCGQKFTHDFGDQIRTCEQCRGQSRIAPTLVCQRCGIEFRQRQGRKTKYCSKECRYAASRKMYSTINRRSADYRRWRRMVIKRDEYTCQDCGATKHLHAHHIKSWAQHPDLAYELCNGITVCSSCHIIRHDGKPIQECGTKRIACSNCGHPITGRGVSSYCRPCALRLSTRANSSYKARNRNTKGQFTHS